MTEQFHSLDVAVLSFLFYLTIYSSVEGGGGGGGLEHHLALSQHGVASFGLRDEMDEFEPMMMMQNVQNLCAGLMERSRENVSRRSFKFCL